MKLLHTTQDSGASALTKPGRQRFSLEVSLWQVRNLNSMLGEFMEVNDNHLFLSQSLIYGAGFISSYAIVVTVMNPMLSPQIILDVWWTGSRTPGLILFNPFGEKKLHSGLGTTEQNLYLLACAVSGSNFIYFFLSRDYSVCKSIAFNDAALLCC